MKLLLITSKGGELRQPKCISHLTCEKRSKSSPRIYPALMLPTWFFLKRLRASGPSMTPAWLSKKLWGMEPLRKQTHSKENAMYYLEITTTLEPPQTPNQAKFTKSPINLAIPVNQAVPSPHSTPLFRSYLKNLSRWDTSSHSQPHKPYHPTSTTMSTVLITKCPTMQPITASTSTKISNTSLKKSHRGTTTKTQLHLQPSPPPQQQPSYQPNCH